MRLSLFDSPFDTFYKISFRNSRDRIHVCSKKNEEEKNYEECLKTAKTRSHYRRTSGTTLGAHGPWPCNTCVTQKGGSKWIVRGKSESRLRLEIPNRTSCAFKGRLKGGKKRGRRKKCRILALTRFRGGRVRSLLFRSRLLIKPRSPRVKESTRRGVEPV